ncbi:MAG: hypothetical protein E7277_01445 [Lachnospiraceae bacterium]|nr:hypothetical protein [Lachnospiraceae bacterium]
MNEQLQFLENMKRIAQIGKEKDGHITRDDIVKELNMELNEAQWEVMGDFLANRQVLLDGYTPKVEIKKEPAYQYSQDEINFMHFYEEDLQGIVRKSEAELENMIKNGEEVYEFLLPWIYEMCKEYANGSEPLGDLVQEANLKAFTYVNKMTATDGDISLQSLESDIRDTLRLYASQNIDTLKEQSKIVDKLNQLVEATEALKAQNASFTIEDISEFLDISVDEIEQLLKIAGE